MRIQIYRYECLVTRSILRATCVAEVDADELPDDLDGFAREHGGDFIEINHSEDE